MPLALIMPEAGEGYGGTQLPKLGALLSRHGQGAAERGFGFGNITRRAGQERFGPEAMQLGLEPALLGPFHDRQRFGQQSQRLGWTSRLSVNACQQAQKKGLLIN